MADWILNFTRGGVKDKKQLSAQARELLKVGLWGVPLTAQAKDKLAVGDRLLVYVGAPEKVLIGDAKVLEAWHEWDADELARYPPSSLFAGGISLSDVLIWPKPLPLAQVWSSTHAAKTNPNGLWYGAAVRITQSDFESIWQAGNPSGQMNKKTVPDASVLVPTPVVGAGAAPSGTQEVETPSVLPEAAEAFRVAARLRAFLAKPKPLNETSTRAFFLDRMFDALGYKDFSDIDHGSAVQSGDYPDYVLKAEGQPVVAVEAKRLGHQLGTKEASQLVKYCSVLGLRWGLLTDGRFFQVYDAPLTGVPPEERLVLEIDVNDWADREDFELRRWPELMMLSQGAMKHGHSLERYAARELIRTLLTSPTSLTVGALRNELEWKKVLIKESEVVSLINELLT